MRRKLRLPDRQRAAGNALPRWRVTGGPLQAAAWTAGASCDRPPSTVHYASVRGGSAFRGGDNRSGVLLGVLRCAALASHRKDKVRIFG